MGNKLKGITQGIGRYHPLGAIASPKNNLLAKMLGLSGEQGEYFQGPTPPELLDAADSQIYKDQQAREAVNSDAGVAQALAAYGQGQMSLSDALASASAGKSGAQMGQVHENMATDPLSGSRLATEQVQTNAILGKLFGKDGALDRANAEEQELAKRGYSLQPEDYEAYGQMQDELARSFAGQEQGLAKALADRGLGAAPNGIAGQQFAGLQGNKFEHLASLQRKVANDRMAMNKQRLDATRNFMTSLGNQAAGAIDDQHGRNLSGVQLQKGERESMMNAEQNRVNAVNSGRLGLFQQQSANDHASMLNKQDNQGQTLLQGFGRGLYGGVQSLGQQVGSGSIFAPGGLGRR